MTTVDLITALFYEVDEQLRTIPKHPEAHLWPSEVVTLGLLHALKGGGNRPFYRWLTRDYPSKALILMGAWCGAHTADTTRKKTGMRLRPYVLSGVDQVE